MKNILMLLLLLILSKAKAQYFNLNYKVNNLFIFTGESNSGGKAPNSEAPGSEVGVRTEINKINEYSLTYETLNIGVNNILDHNGITEPASTHGFELELANKIKGGGTFYFNPSYIVKTGQGGSIISQWATSGSYYKKFTQRVNAAKALMPTDNYRVVIFISLGINDANNATDPDVWKTAMKVHIQNMRNTVGFGNNTIVVLTKFMTTYSAFNARIDQICTEMNNVFCIVGSDLSLVDSAHWNYAGMKILTDRLLAVIESNQN